MKTKVLLFVITLMSFTFGCTNSSNQNDQVVVNATASIGENLNLQAVGDIVKNSKTPQEIEQKLNQENGINNLDLDGDGKTDYLKVTEYGSGNQHGYSICAVLKDGEPEVAKIEVNTTNNNQVQMTVNGNQQYYGNNNCYQSNFTMTDFLLLSYIMSPTRMYYSSPYHYGYYGYGYVGRPTVSYHSYYNRPSVTTYRTTTKTYRTVNNYQSNIKSPNSNNISKTASTHVTNLSNPSRSQKSFSTGSGSAPRSGGFGSKSSGYSGSKSSPSRSSSPSHSSWGHSSGGSHSSGSHSSGGRRCDIRAKENIQIFPTESIFTQISKVDVATYYYNPIFVRNENLPSDKQIGYLAQNVETIFPTVVYDDISGKNVDYFQMTAINTAAIKSLIKAVTDLQKENAELKAKLNSR